jgi:LmbE family N-acetylglucosaminyl deacetylase
MPHLEAPRTGHGDPVDLTTIRWPGLLRLLVLAPHPDDFDAIGVTMRFFHRDGHPILVAVVSGSASGVLDDFCVGAEAKAAVREEEQRASLRFFGLPDSALTFLRCTEDEGGDPEESPANQAAIAECLAGAKPDVVLLPHGRDTNLGHQRVWAMFRRVAPDTPALLIRDPKTLEFRTDLCMPFGENAAAWKRQLLKHHRSQDYRNLAQRGIGFDERILRVNRSIAEELGLKEPFAEAFQVDPPDAIASRPAR